MSGEPQILEEHKRRLVEHIANVVTNGITGRDSADLLTIEPKKAIFAGVLYPPSLADLVRDTPPPRTSIGLEFKVRPAAGRKSITLKIQPRWTHYYPVFPSWEELVTARKAEMPVEKPKTEGGTEGVGAEGEKKPEPPKKPESTVVTLAVKYRAARVEAEGIAFEVPLKEPLDQSVVAEALARAVDAARQKAAKDADLWKHLAEPKKAERRVTDPSILESAEKYRAFVDRLGANKVSLPDWKLALRVTTTAEPAGVVRVRVVLVNQTPEVDPKGIDIALEERAVFDAGLAVDIQGGSVEPFEFLLAPSDYRSNSALLAKGINCSARCKIDAVSRVETDTVPVYWQPLYRTREVMPLAFEALSDDGVSKLLDGLYDHMAGYERQWRDYLAGAAKTELTASQQQECERDRQFLQDEIGRLQLGLECLRRDPLLLDAFKLMNKAFGIIGQRSGGKIKAWRLFQLGFIVSQLPALAVRNLNSGQTDDFAAALRRMHSEVGILWFPTGGGKTEAYLGLIAIALLFDRLRGKTRGVCTWMRFPLRMLSLQQLERLARVVSVLNELRGSVPRIAAGDPFSIGYFVGGSSVTPNSISPDDMDRYASDENFRARVRLIRKCPHCGSDLSIQADRKHWRLAHVCGNKDCFSNTSDSLGIHKGTIPIFVADTEIYRYLPSVLVGTVDKLAAIGFQPLFAHIVRGSNQACEDHGYASYGNCIEHFNASCTSKRKLKKLDAVIDPGPALLVQDELHLLREELGVFNGHYESLLAYLGDQVFMRPKVLAATATIEAYDIQAFHIYLNPARRFPAPGWRLGESFYATSSPPMSRRCYIGVLNHGRAVEDPTIRLFDLYQREVRRLSKNPAEARTIMACAGASDAAVLEAIRLYDLSVFYVNKKAVGGSLIDRLGRVEQGLLSDGLGGIEKELLTGDQGLDHVGEVLERIEKERNDTGGNRLSALAATSLISHGVDLDRINMMVVAGMPSHYAEYVQSSSRTARSHPGLAFVCFGTKDPRESSQYELFYPMHEHMDRLIEPVAVNRFAVNAPEKTLPGLLSGLLLCDLTPRLFGKDIPKPLDDTRVLKAALGLAPEGPKGTRPGCITRDELRVALQRIVGTEVSSPYVTQAEQRVVAKKVDEVFETLLGAIGREMELKLKVITHPISSFRDIDEGLEFMSSDSSGLVTKLMARG